MKINFKKNLITVCVLAATSSMGVYANDESSDKINSTVDVSFRYRIETVDQETVAKDAKASTLLTRATIKTNWTSKIDSVLEFDDVSELGMDDYNAGAGNTPDRTMYPAVVDPVGTEVNQAFARYNGESVKVGLGRQRILIDNQRFVGGVGWRQNEQTYDSVTVKSNFTGNLSFDYAYVFNVNRIFGEAVDDGDHTHNTHLLNLDYKMNAGKLSGYVFSIDNEDALALSSNTFGLSFAGKAGDFAYRAELATQSDTGDNPNNYSANYYLLDATYNINSFSVGAAYEVLGGDVDGGQGFTTSLATAHAFQGWADLFLATPAAGIEDFYIKGSYATNGYKFLAVYHDFSSDEGSIDYGTEFDFSVSKSFNKNLSGLVKYANFDGEAGVKPSVTKIWFMLTYKL